jgi:hypothetical protein
MTDDLIALRLSDGDLKRAENILRAGGFIINETAARMLPHMANAIRIYRHMDRAAACNEALEEAAKMCEECPLYDEDGVDWNTDPQVTLAAAIRALKEKKDV